MIASPHKEKAPSLADALDDARISGAVNLFVRADERLRGHNTDADGIRAGLVSILPPRQGSVAAKRGGPWRPAGARGRWWPSSSARGSSMSRSSTVTCTRPRRWSRTSPGWRATWSSGRRPWHDAIIEAELERAELLVNASGVGVEEGELPIAADLIPPDRYVLDLVLTRPVTPLMAAAKERGGTVANGQAAFVAGCAQSVRLLTGTAPPLDALRAALAAETGVPEEAGRGGRRLSDDARTPSDTLYDEDPVIDDRRADARLADRLRAGDAEALGELYDRYAPAALATALRVLGNRDEAEDVLHDAYVAVWRKIDRFDAERGSLRAWLMTVVRNRAIDRVRGRRVGMDVEDADERSSCAGPNPTLEAAIARSSAGDVRAALAELPEDQRRAVELAYFEGYTYREVAEMTGVPPGTASGRLRLALSKLRETLHGTSAAPLPVAEPTLREDAPMSIRSGIDYITVDELAAAYGLGAVGRDEELAIAAHLETCDRPHAEARELIETAGLVPDGLEPVAPSAGLRDRLMATVAETPQEHRPAAKPVRPVMVEAPDGAAEERRPWWRMAPLLTAVAAVAVAVAVGLGGWGLSLQQQIAERDAALEAVASADAVHPAEGAAGRGWVIENGDQAMFMAEDLAALDAGQLSSYGSSTQRATRSRPER